MSELKEGDKIYYHSGFWLDDGQILDIVKNTLGILSLQGFNQGISTTYYTMLYNTGRSKWVTIRDYFIDPYNPSQQEVDMFNMLFGTQFTKEDLQFENINSSSSSD